jgi:hypothetical protein
MKNTQPPGVEEVIVHVPKGLGKHVRVEEVDPHDMPNEITVRVSRQRKPGTVPVLGVMIK